MTNREMLREQLKGKFNLVAPIEINGKEVKSLSYDLMKIDEELLAKADSLAQAGKKINEMVIGENDYAYHRYLGMAAVIAENPWIDWEDLKRLKGIDLNRLSRVGRDFFAVLGESPDESSENAQEPTADTSTQA